MQSRRVQKQDDGEDTNTTPETANRLDALSRSQAERVLQRAIELHSDDQHGPDRISRQQLDQIASELGIDATYVRNALAAELETSDQSPTLSTRERLLAPDVMSGGRTAEADRATIERSINNWLRTAEGFRPRAKTQSGYKWERNDHWSTKLRLTLGGKQATGSLRGLKTLTHRQTDLGDGRQLVELDADTRIVSLTAGGIAGGFGVAGTVAGVVAAFGISGGPDAGQFLMVMAPTTAIGMTAGFITAKAWASSIRRGIDRALDGIASPELQERRPPRTGLARVLDKVSNVIDDVFD